MNVNDTVFTFWNSQTGRAGTIDVSSAVFESLGALSYVGHLSDRLRAYCVDNSLPWHGPLYTIEKIATDETWQFFEE